MMNVAERRGTAGGAKRPKRIITDARKEQNRVAQKLYRQRQKERAQSREVPRTRNDLPGKQRPLKPRQTEVMLAEASKSTAFGSVSAVATELQSNHDTSEMLSTLDNIPDVSRSLGLDFPMQDSIVESEWNSSDMLSLSMPSNTLFPSPDLGTLVNTPSYMSQASGVVSGMEEAILPDSLSASSSFDILVANQPLLTPEELEELNSPHLQKLASQICYSRRHEIHEIFGQKLQLATSIVVGESRDSHAVSLDAPLNRIPGIEVFVSAVTEFLYGKSGPGCNPIAGLPDPHRNVLQCSQTATLVAYLHNARCIGLDMQDLLVHQSPFYNPTTSASDDPQALLATVQKPWIPIHLQPTLPQVLMQHHPWLDLLPFPTLRARAIMLGASTPQLFHPMELKKDIFTGIYCQPYCDRIGSGQPWDIGSWKAAPWFLKKWRLLMG